MEVGDELITKISIAVDAMVAKVTEPLKPVLP